MLGFDCFFVTMVLFLGIDGTFQVRFRGFDCSVRFGSQVYDELNGSGSAGSEVFNELNGSGSAGSEVYTDSDGSVPGSEPYR
jgi:hypothetical protein